MTEKNIHNGHSWNGRWGVFGMEVSFIARCIYIYTTNSIL